MLFRLKGFLHHFDLLPRLWAASSLKRMIKNTMTRKTKRKPEKKTDLPPSRAIIEDIMRNLQALEKEINKLVSKKTSSQ
jgi:hypothetical protein